MRVLVPSLLLALVAGCAPALPSSATQGWTPRLAEDRANAISLAVHDAVQRRLPLGDVHAERYGELWMVSVRPEAGPGVVYVVSPRSASVRSVVFVPVAMLPLHAQETP